MAVRSTICRQKSRCLINRLKSGKFSTRSSTRSRRFPAWPFASFNVYSAGEKARKIYQGLDAMAALNTVARERGDVRVTTADVRIGHAIFASYSSEVRLWIGEVNRGMASGALGAVGSDYRHHKSGSRCRQWDGRCALRAPA